MRDIKSTIKDIDCNQCECYYCSRNKNGCKGCEGCFKKTIVNHCKQFSDIEDDY